MLSFDGVIYLGLYYGALALTAYALVDALIRPAAGYVAAGKLTKPAWAAITALAVLIVFWQGPMSFLGLPAIIAGRLPGRRPARRPRPASRRQRLVTSGQ